MYEGFLDSIHMCVYKLTKCTDHIFTHMLTQKLTVPLPQTVRWPSPPPSQCRLTNTSGPSTQKLPWSSTMSSSILAAATTQTQVRLETHQHSVHYNPNTGVHSIQLYLYSAITIQLSEGALQSPEPGPP